MSEESQSEPETDDELPTSEPPGFKMLVMLVFCIAALAIVAVVLLRRLKFGVD